MLQQTWVMQQKWEVKKNDVVLTAGILVSIYLIGCLVVVTQSLSIIRQNLQTFFFFFLIQNVLGRAFEQYMTWVGRDQWMQVKWRDGKFNLSAHFQFLTGLWNNWRWDHTTDWFLSPLSLSLSHNLSKDNATNKFVRHGRKPWKKVRLTSASCFINSCGTMAGQ